MGKKEQAPALAIFVQGSLWVWSATSRGRPPDGGLALAVFHMVPRVPAAPNLVVHPPADLRNILLPPSSRPARLLHLTVVCPIIPPLGVVCFLSFFVYFMALSLRTRTPQG